MGSRFLPRGGTCGTPRQLCCFAKPSQAHRDHEAGDSPRGYLEQGTRSWMYYKIPLVLTPQPEGGYTVTSPLLPELVTEGDALDEALRNVRDAVDAVVELYQDLGRSLPINAQVPDASGPIWLETLVASP